MTNEQMAELMKRLDALAAKLGVTAGEVWRILVQQTRVEIYETLLGAVLAVLVTVVAYRMWQGLVGKRQTAHEEAELEQLAYAARKVKWFHDHDCAVRQLSVRCYHTFEEAVPKDPTVDGYGRQHLLAEMYPVQTVITVIIGVVAGGLLIETMGDLFSLPTLLFNPEYAALQKLIALF